MANIYLDSDIYGTTDLVFSGVSQATGVEKYLIEHKTRKREIVIPRQVYCWLSTQHTKLSLKDIGKTIGGRSHSTVLYGRNGIQTILDTWADHHERLNPKDRKLALLVFHLNHLFKEAKRNHEISKSRGTDVTDFSNKGKNGYIEAGHQGPTTPRRFVEFNQSVIEEGGD